MKKIGFIAQTIALFAMLPVLIVLHINMGAKENRQQNQQAEQESAGIQTERVFIAQYASVKETVNYKTSKMKRMKQRKASKKVLPICRLAEIDNIFENSLYRNKPSNRLKIKTLCLEKGLIQKQMPSTIMNELMRPVADDEPQSAADTNAIASTNNLLEKEWLITPMLL